MKTENLINFLFFTVLVIPLVSATSVYAKGTYDIYLRNNQVMQGYKLYKTKKDSNVLVAKKNGNRIEINKKHIKRIVSIGKSDTSGRSGTSKHTSGNLPSICYYKFGHLLDQDVNFLRSQQSLVHDTMMSKYKQLDTIKYGTKKYKDKKNNIEKLDKCRKNVNEAIVSIKGIEAEGKLDDGDYSTASELGRLIERKVEMDMLFD